jgi:hypothetical protein
MTMRPPPADPAELANFPSRQISASYPYVRIHAEANEPEWFCTCGDHRFDPPAGAASAFGTCYLAGAPLGAFIEKFGDLPLIARSRIDGSRIAYLQVPAAVVADITARGALGWGVTAELSSGDYPVAQQWAQRFFEAGYAGIWYSARHDTRSDLHSLALFGKSGVHPEAFTDSWTEHIDDELIATAERTFNLQVLPAAAI